MLKTHFIRLTTAMQWADQRTLAALAACPAAAAEALPLAAHLLGAEEVWLARLEQRATTVAVWPTLSLTECTALAATNAAGYAAYLDSHSEASLADVIEYRNQAGVSFATAVADILTQVFTHGPYHRGQIAKIIARAGGKPPETDYIFYVRSLAADTI